MPRQKAYEVIRELVRIAHHERNNRIAARWAGEMVTDELRRLRSAGPTGLPRAVPGMAYFEDTGPLGTTCGQCAHFHAYRRVCQQFIKFMGGRGGEAPQIKQSQRSCKYWRRR